MIEWLIKELFKIILNAGADALSRILSAFKFDLTYFTSKIPIVAESYSLFQAMGVGLVILFMIWQAFKTFGAPFGIEGDDPIKVMFKSILAMFCIYNGQVFFNLGFITLRPVYTKIVSLSTGYTPSANFDYGSLFNGTIRTFIEGATGLVLAELIIYGLVLLFVLFQLFKMVIEITERYIILCIMAVTSPLGFSTMTSKATSNIFAAWSRMAIGQFIVYLLNLWSFQLFINSFSQLGTTLNFSGDGLSQLVFIWALLKVTQKLDQLIGKLGIEVGNAGGSLMEEMMLARMVIGGGIGGKGGVAGALGKGGNSAVNTAMKASSAGATVAGAGLVARGLGAVGQFGINQFKKSPISGLIRYNQNGAGASAFKTARAQNAQKRLMDGKSNDTIGGKISNHLAGTRARMAENFNTAIGKNATIGSRIATKLNAPPTKDNIKAASMTMGEKQFEKLEKSPSVAANTLGNLHKGNDDGQTPQAIFKGLCGNDESLGGLSKEMVENGGVKLAAYNGGLTWSYEDKVKGGTNKTEGVIAVTGNNDATRWVANMRNQSGASGDNIKSNGINISYASKKTFVPEKPQYNQKKEKISYFLGADGKPINHKK